MPHIIAIHSFRRGTGKTTTTANLAALLAVEGRRVGVVDANLPSPSLHILFGLDEARTAYSLNDYLAGKCSIGQAAHNVTASLNGQIRGEVFLIPASTRPREITRLVSQGYDVNLLDQGVGALVKELRLDVLFIDTAGGLNEETLLSIVIADALAILLRPDQQDYQGTGVAVAVARRLTVPHLQLIVNAVPATFDSVQVKAQVEQVYACQVAAVLPHSEEISAFASAGVFALRYPDHQMTMLYKQVAAKLVGVK